VPRARGKDKGEEHGQQPRSFWSGTIAFGLVSIPVSLFVANRRGGIPLRMVDADGTPLSRRYFCSKDEEPLDRNAIVRGYEVEPGHFITVTDEELAALAPEKSREIDLKRFVPLRQIDPIYFERAYFLAPERGATKAYRLLARAMEDAGRAGIATFVMRDKEHLVAIIGEGGLLRAELLRFRDDLRTPDDVGLPAERTPETGHIAAIEHEMRSLAAEALEREALADEHRQRLSGLIEQKLRAGEDVYRLPEETERAAEEEEEAEVVDLMQVLKRSLAEAPRRTQAGPRPERRARGRRTESARPTGSKSELYERARELGIEGRSTMTKQQLAEAIRDAR
jgi:DNA end-binding protein Ku